MVEGSPKRKRAPTDNVYPEYTPDATDSPGPKRSNALKRGRKSSNHSTFLSLIWWLGLLDAPPKTNADARENFIASPATPTSCTNIPPNEMQSEPTATSEISVDNLNFTTDQQESSNSQKPEEDSQQIDFGKRRHIGGTATQQLETVQMGRRKQELVIMYKESTDIIYYRNPIHVLQRTNCPDTTLGRATL